MAPTNDYGTRIRRSSGLLRIATLLNNWLHFSSAIIVLGISAYFINNYTHNTHLVYWLTIACIDAAAYLPALAHPFIDPIYKGRFLQPIQWLFSYLWLTAFIFASQDYNFNDTCARSPGGVNKCGIKRTLEAFAFIAFFTNIAGQLIETALFGLASTRHPADHHAALPEKPLESTPATSTSADGNSGATV